MHRVYLDNNATTPLLPEVFEAMRPYFFEKFGNASSIHQQGQQARSAVEHAREQVAELLNCRPAEIVFTSGGTEGDNLALFGLMKPGDHIITSAVEHHAVLNACKRLEEMGCAVTYLPVDGRALVDPDDVRRALRPETKLISIILANNETGVLQPVSEIGKIAAEADVYFHTDAVQAAGKVPLDVKEIGCDLLTITGHKMHGPQGAGALFVRKGTLAAADDVWRASRTFAASGNGEPAGHRWTRQGGGDCSRRICGRQRRANGCAARPAGARDRRDCRADWREQRRCAARAQHDQHLLRLHRRRSHGDRARPQGAVGFDRRGVFVRRDRAVACADRDGTVAGPRARQHPLQPGQAEHGGRCGLRAVVGAGSGGAAA